MVAVNSKITRMSLYLLLACTINIIVRFCKTGLLNIILKLEKVVYLFVYFKSFSIFFLVLALITIATAEPTPALGFLKAGTYKLTAQMFPVSTIV